MKKILKTSLILVLALAVFGLWLIALFHISNLWRGDSDNAYLVIAGNAIDKGNYILRGYYLSQLDPFYSIDMFVNAAFVKILGFRPLVMHVVPVFLYTVFILIAGFYLLDLKHKDKIKTEKSSGGIVFKTGIFLFTVFLVFPSRGFAFWALQEGMHLTAIIVSLSVFLLIDRFIKKGSYLFLVTAFIVLTAGFANDNTNVLICAAPLIVLSLIFIIKEVFWKNNMKKSIWNNIKSYVLIIISVIAAYLVKEFAFYEIKTHGGFTLAPSGLAIAFVRLKYIGKNLYFYTNGMLNLLGVKLFGKYLFSLRTIIEIFKITGLIIFVYGIKAAVKKIKKLKNDDLIDILLFGGMFFMSFAFLVSRIPVDKASSRYLMPVAAFGLILAIRNFGFILNDFIKKAGGNTLFNDDVKSININTTKNKKNNIADKDLKTVLLKLYAAVIFTAYTGSFILNSTAVIPKSPVRPLGKWLIKHNLTYGYGSFKKKFIIM